jgi:hypothetical protein
MLGFQAQNGKNFHVCVHEIHTRVRCKLTMYYFNIQLTILRIMWVPSSLSPHKGGVFRELKTENTYRYHFGFSSWEVILGRYSLVVSYVPKFLYMEVVHRMVGCVATLA